MVICLTGAANAQDTCADLLDFAELCVPDTMGIENSIEFPEVLLTGPIGGTSDPVAFVFPLGPRLGEPAQLRRAVEWQIERGSRNPTITATRLRDEPTDVGDRDAYLIVQGFSIPGDVTPRPTVYLGIRFEDRVVVVTTQDGFPNEEFDDIIESARIVAAMIQPMDAPE